MKIGTVLLRLRKERRLSQLEVAERVGVCQSAYCAWESDRATPSARHYGPLATLFGVDLAALMAGTLVNGASPQHASPLPAANLPVATQDEIVAAQREIIMLQKQQIEHLKAENQLLRQRLTNAGKKVTD